MVRVHTSSMVTALAAALLCACAGTTTAQEVDLQHKAPVSGEKYNYAQSLYLSFLFYEAQRSGKLPSDNRIPWRGDSAMHDGSDAGVDLSGGWYDAGDHVKFTFPMAYSATVLLWGMLEWTDAYVASGEWDNALQGTKWALDFLLKAHTDKDTFYVQVGDGNADHGFWGPAEAMTMSRPSYKVGADSPGSEPCAEAAAALAAGYLVFKQAGDDAYAETLLASAISLYDLAYNYQGSFHTSEPFYKSWSGFKDELAWGGAWLYRATGDDGYLHKAVDMYSQCCDWDQNEFSWDTKGPGVQVLLYNLTGDSRIASHLSSFGKSWMSMRRTPRGLSYYQQWAPLRYAANAALIMLMAADNGINTEQFRQYAMSQVHYVLGDGRGGVNPSTGNPYYSYLIGLGDDFPRAPHHRGASCTASYCVCNTQAEPHVLYGALVGGPDDQDNFANDCNDYVKGEVATDYNAAFTSAVAGLKHLSLTGQLPALAQPANRNLRGAKN